VEPSSSATTDARKSAMRANLAAWHVQAGSEERGRSGQAIHKDGTVQQSYAIASILSHRHD